MNRNSILFLIILAFSGCAEPDSGMQSGNKYDSILDSADTEISVAKSDSIIAQPLVQIPDSEFYLSKLESEIYMAFEFAKSLVFDSAFATDNSDLTGFDFCSFKEQRKSNTLGYRIHSDGSGKILMIEQHPLKPGYFRCNYFVYTSRKNPRFRFLFPVEIREDGSSTMLKRCCILNDSLHNKTLFLLWNTPPRLSLSNLASVMLLDCENLDVESFIGFENGGFLYTAQIERKKNDVLRNYYFASGLPSIWKYRLTDLYNSLENPMRDSDSTKSRGINFYDGKVFYPLWYKYGMKLYGD